MYFKITSCNPHVFFLHAQQILLLNTCFSQIFDVIRNNVIIDSTMNIASKTRLEQWSSFSNVGTTHLFSISYFPTVRTYSISNVRLYVYEQRFSRFTNVMHFFSAYSRAQCLSLDAKRIQSWHCRLSHHGRIS